VRRSVYASEWAAGGYRLYSVPAGWVSVVAQTVGTTVEAVQSDD
jgi:hypothetical protein